MPEFPDDPLDRTNPYREDLAPVERRMLVALDVAIAAHYYVATFAVYRTMPSAFGSLANKATGKIQTLLRLLLTVAGFLGSTWASRLKALVFPVEYYYDVEAMNRLVTEMFEETDKAGDFVRSRALGGKKKTGSVKRKRRLAWVRTERK